MSNVWGLYEDRAGVRGITKRESALNREKRYITTKLPDNLSYQNITIDGEARNVAILNSDNLNEKTIISMPGEDIRHGGLVYWMNNYWLIIERDANMTVYTKGKLLQCNYLLKWVDNEDLIHEQWCAIEDGTKYLTGEYEDRNFIVTRGDSRIAMTIARNELTAEFGREYRFLIDDPMSTQKLAYSLTKPLKVGNFYDESNGIYKFVLQEVNSTDDDNQELCIADYYKHFPRPGERPEESDPESNPEPAPDETKEEVWI